MKTNMTLRSGERKLLGTIISQELKTEMLSVSDLQKAYDEVRVEKGWSVKRIADVIDSVDFVERCYYTLREQGDFIKTGIHVFTDLDSFKHACESDGTVKVLKSIGAWVTKGRAENKRTMCNPYIWVLLAMEMNPEIYGKVVVWLTDNLLFQRDLVGELHKELSAKLCLLEDYEKGGTNSVISVAINQTVCGSHSIGIRNNFNNEQLRDLERIQDRLGFAIEEGYIETVPEALSYLAKEKRKIEMKLLQK